MTSPHHQWQEIKANYLKQVENNLAQAEHPKRSEILADVNEHLDNKYAELSPERQTWECFQQIIIEMGPPEEYAELLGVDGHGIANSGTSFTTGSIHHFESSIRSQFVLLSVFWWIGYPLLVIGSFIPPIEILGTMAMVTATVFWCILLYRHWLVLQGHGARTTPGRAVGFGFIPIYCFYWWFVAYAGLATDTNRYLEQIGATHCRMSRKLAITDCVLSILLCTVGLIPVVGAIFLIPAMVIGFILVVQQKNCIYAILHHDKESELNL